MSKRYLVVGVLVVMAVACQPQTLQEEDVTPPRLAATLSPEPSIRPSLSPSTTPTPSPIVRATRMFAPAATSIPTQVVGGPHLGYQLSVPQSWVDTSDFLHNGAVGGSNTLFWADEAATARQLLAGEEPEAGVFVLAFLLEKQQGAGQDAVGLLSNLLAGADPAALASLPTVEAIVVNGVAAGFVDVVRQPLGLPAGNAAPMRLRLLLLLPEQPNFPLLVQFGAGSERWADFQNQFDRWAYTIQLHDLYVATALSQLEQPVRMQERLFSGQGRTARLNARYDDVWTFDATSGQYLTLRVGPIGGMSMVDLQVTLLSPSGKTRLSLDNGYSGDIETITDVLLDETGRYILLVRELRQAAGAYRAHMSLAAEPQFTGGGIVTIGEVLDSHLLPGAEQRWRFTGSAGQIVNVVLTPETESLDAILELSGPTGDIVLSLDEGFSGDAEVISDLNLPITGEYTIRIYEFGRAGGPYVLSVTEGSEQTENFHDAGDVLFGQPQQARLHVNEVHAWFFTGLAGDRITLTVTPLDSNLDLDLWLLDPDVNRLASVDAYMAGQPETITYILDGEGEHIVLIREFAGLPGSYQLLLAHEGNQRTIVGGTLMYGELVTGTVQSNSSALWQFTGEAGDVITMDAQPLDGVDLVLLLRDPAGNVVSIVNERRGGEAEQQPIFVLNQSGRWQIVVRGFFDGSGTFTLQMRHLE